MFNLLSDNFQTILTSETYMQKQNVLHAIESVKIYSQIDERYIRKNSIGGSPYFVLTAPSGEPIGTSEMYSSIAAREAGIAAVKRIAPGAWIDDKTY